MIPKLLRLRQSSWMLMLMWLCTSDLMPLYFSHSKYAPSRTHIFFFLPQSSHVMRLDLLWLPAFLLFLFACLSTTPVHCIAVEFFFFLSITFFPFLICCLTQDVLSKYFSLFVKRNVKENKKKMGCLIFFFFLILFSCTSRNPILFLPRAAQTTADLSSNSYLQVRAIKPTFPHFGPLGHLTQA